MRADDAGDGVAVGHRDRGQAELGGTADILLRVAAPGEEGEVRRGTELGEGHAGYFIPLLFSLRVDRASVDRARPLLPRPSRTTAPFLS
jgi:hypothetical protein